MPGIRLAVVPEAKSHGDFSLWEETSRMPVYSRVSSCDFEETERKKIRIVKIGGFMSVQEWLDRGDMDEDPFNKFSNYWRAFNNQFFRAGNGNERDKIKTLLKNLISARAREILQRYESEVAYLVSVPVNDMRGNDRNTSGNIADFQLAIEPEEKLFQLFMIIYQVRCNFEHGEKIPSNARDTELCRTAAPIVADVVRHFI